MAAPFSERSLTFLGILGALIALGVGLVVFYSRYQYAETGQDFLAITFMMSCVMFFFGIRLWNIPLLALAVMLMVGTQVYSSKKFDWRQSYIELAQAGQPFFLEEFIDQYPTFEEYTFSFLGAPDWVRFNDECVQPALLNQPVPPRCGNFDLIQRYYRIDLVNAMSNYFGKMKRTAKMIEEGKMTKRSAYAECIANKVCATIPLLPKGVDANKLDPTSRDYIGIRQAFWSLINDKKMSQEVCALTPLCRALVNMKVADPARLPF